MGKVIGYLRVSTDKQQVDGQRLQILDAANAAGLTVTEWRAFEVSSRRSMDERGITAMLAAIEAGDMIIVAELSRLGRSLVQVVGIVDQILAAGVKLWSIKEGLRLGGEMDIAAKAMVGMFGLMAEIERDLISQRTKAGLAAARAKGKQLGAPKGARWSKLDQHEEEIRGYLAKGVSVASIAKILGVSRSTMHGHCQRRGWL